VTSKRIAALLAVIAAILIVPTTAAAQPSNVHYWGNSTYGGSTVRSSAYTGGGQITQVATANGAWYVLRANGQVTAWGGNTYGELGDGATSGFSTAPKRVAFPAGVSIAYLADTGPQGSMLAVDTTGRAWGWGYNKWGELCTGDMAMQLVPTPISVPGQVTAIAGAGDHTLIVSDGTLYECGGNGDGDLGIGSTTPSTTPVIVPLSGVTQVFASWRNSGALMDDGTLESWGYGAQGEVGNGSTDDALSPVAIPLPGAVTSASWGGSLKTNGTVLAVADGVTYSWGDDDSGQLGDGTNLSTDSPEATGASFVKVESGGTTGYGLTAGGQLFGWGDDSKGQLGDGGGPDAMTPQLIDTGITQISATANVVEDLAG
jgi:alpha-tubulin suppressor-like RCC1 family protein